MFRSLAACLLLAVSAVACAGCAAQPAWLLAKISELEGLPVANPPRAILRTTYQGEPAYFLTPTCCDIPSELYDQAGRLICRPGGGFAGGDGGCPGFTPSPTAATVWRDLRDPHRR